MKTLEMIITQLREDAAVLERNALGDEASFRVRLADDIEGATEEYRTFLTESDAMLRSGRSREWLRGRFAAWERDGHARVSSKQRRYRMCVIPRRIRLSDAAEQGAEAARRQRKAG